MNNAAFVGGGVSSVVGLGAYNWLQKTNPIRFNSFSGASIGAVIAVSLAAGKNPREVLNFLETNVENFCKPIVGKNIIQHETDMFLDDIKYRDLPCECIISITPITRKKDFPVIITRENSGELTAGEAASLSASLPGLFLPGRFEYNGKKSFILDGGMTFNPPLRENCTNYLFAFSRAKTSNSVFQKRKLTQEKKADYLFKIPTTTSTRGNSSNVRMAFCEGELWTYDNIYSVLHKKTI